MSESFKNTVFSFVLPGQQFIFKRSAFAQRYVKIDYNAYTTLGAFETFSGTKVTPSGTESLSKAEKLRMVDRDHQVLLIAQNA